MSVERSFDLLRVREQRDRVMTRLKITCTKSNHYHEPDACYEGTADDKTILWLCDHMLSKLGAD